MTIFPIRFLNSVMFLTLFSLFLSGCALSRRFDVYEMEECKNRAYLQFGIDHYLSRRYPRGAPVRMAIVPYAVPENLASMSQEFPGTGNKIAWEIQQNLLRHGVAPIVEVFNRQDWPAKKGEFHSGNFSGLQFAREAGYDLVLLGYLHRPTTMGDLKAETKIIDAESGVTIWYGESHAFITDPDHQRTGPWYSSTRTPSKIGWNPLVSKLSYCIATGVQGEMAVP